MSDTIGRFNHEIHVKRLTKVHVIALRIMKNFCIMEFSGKEPCHKKSIKSSIYPAVIDIFSLATKCQ